MKRVVVGILIAVFLAESAYLIYLARKVKRLEESQISNTQESREVREEKVSRAEQARPKEKGHEFSETIESWIAQWKPKATAKSIAQYNELLKDNPQDAGVHFTLGQTYLCLAEQQDKAQFHFQKALELAPNHPQEKVVRFWLRHYEAQKKQRGMFRELEEQSQAIKKAGNNAQEYVKMARVYRKYNMLEPAHLAYKKSVEFAPENGEIMLEAAMFLKTDYYVEALEYFRKILPLQPGHAQKEEIGKEIKILEEKIGKQKLLYVKSAISEEELLSALQAQLSDSSIIQKQLAIERLSSIKSKGAVAILTSCIDQKEDREIQRQATAALLKIGTEPARKRLEEILYDTQAPSTKIIDALLAYTQWGENQDIAVLQKWLENPGSSKYRHQGEWVIKEIQRRKGK